MTLPAAHLRVVHHLVTRLGDDFTWAITGSTSFALQGLPLTPNDIDLQTDEAGAYAIERRLAEYVSRKVAYSATERVRSHFGALVIAGLTVEIMGALETRLADGSWGGSTNWAEHIIFVEVADWRVPVLSLAYEHAAYLRLGRLERAAMLAAWLTDRKNAP